MLQIHPHSPSLLRPTGRSRLALDLPFRFIAAPRVDVADEQCSHRAVGRSGLQARGRSRRASPAGLRRVRKY